MGAAALGIAGPASTHGRLQNGSLPTEHEHIESAHDGSRDAPDVDMQDVEGTSRPRKEITNGDGPDTNGVLHDEEHHKAEENGDAAEEASDTASQLTAHRMTTRARANVASTPSPPPSPDGAESIHPLFLFSADSLPDRDVGLPITEAEETRIVLMAYIQKQEEVARATADLYHGLLQADRMRQDVFKWAKSEAHVGEMSDGEDWYDNEEWNLEHDLMKGRDEEDDDTAVAGKKSTRQRRKPDKEDR